MSKSTIETSLRGIIIALCLAAPFHQANASGSTAAPSAQAAAPVKLTAAPPQTIKERLVLMPLRVGDADKSRQAAMEMALVQALQEKYEVFSGEQVSQKAREIFLKESRDTAKKDCDETRCLQGIAEAFQSELLAIANVSREADGYFIALSIQNIFDNKVVFSNSLPCQQCNVYQMVAKIKDILNTSPAKSAETDEFTDWFETKENNTEEAYRAFVARHPDGKYTAQAGDKIWEYVSKRESSRSINSDTVKAYQDFIQGNPKSNSVARAKTKLAEAQKILAPYKPIGLYLGGQAGKAGTITGVKDATSMGVLIGYDISDTYSVELDYVSLYKKVNADVIASKMNPGSTGKFTLSSTSLVAQYAYRLSANTKLLGGAGIHRSSYALESGSATMLSGKSNGWVIGLKADYSLRKFFNLRAEADMYNMGGEIKGRITSVGVAALLKF